MKSIIISLHVFVQQGAQTYIVFVNELERQFQRREQLTPGLFIDPKFVHCLCCGNRILTTLICLPFIVTLKSNLLLAVSPGSVKKLFPYYFMLSTEYSCTEGNQQQMLSRLCSCYDAVHTQHRNNNTNHGSSRTWQLSISKQSGEKCKLDLIFFFSFCLIYCTLIHFTISV